MKAFFRKLIGNITALLFISQLFTSVEVKGSSLGFLTVAVVMSLLEQFIQPVVNLLIMPINLLLFGAMRWVPWVTVVYLTTILTASFVIAPISIRSSEFAGLIVPVISMGHFSSVILISLIIYLIKKAHSWLFTT